MGDSILGFVITEYLYHKFPDTNEGDLTRLRASLVKGEKLAEIAKEINLQANVKLGTGELKSGGWRRNSILANTVEAIIGAVYIDSNFETCRDFIINLYKSHLENISATDVKKDAKTLLQEYLQSIKQNVPEYKTINETGSSHQPEFTVSCELDLIDKPVLATGSSKRKAEQTAARQAMEQLQKLKK